jgi:hypothetical protein
MPEQLQTLDTIFNSRVFRIPDYQRGYAWGPRQLADFWQDLDRLADGRNHYTGQLTLEKAPEPAWKAWEGDSWLIEGRGYQPFYVVDGQQRLTTALILVKCLLDSLADGETLAFADRAEHTRKYIVQTSGISRAYLFGYAKDNPSYEYLKTRIFGQPSNQYEGTETTYTANLAAARDFFAERVKDVPHATRERWFKALTQRLLFHMHELAGDIDVFVAFETMNNRGKPLSKLELLKNRLIYLATLMPGSESDRQALRRNINSAWKDVYYYLGRKKDCPLDDDDFLRAHWIMYFSPESEQLAPFLLEQHFTAERVLDRKLTADAMNDYVTSIQRSVAVWYEINFPAEAHGRPEDVRTWLERLDRLGYHAFGPLLMAVLQQDAPLEQVTALLAAAERFVFIVGRLCHLRSDTGNNRFSRLAGRVFRGERSLAEAIENIGEKFDRHFTLDRIALEMNEEGAGFYSWRGIKYFLFEYEQELRRRARMHTEKIDWTSFIAAKPDFVSIEHIYPQNPKAGDWPAFDARPEDERKRLCHSLGNLLALSVSRNARFSNRPFAKKRVDDGGVVGYQNGSYSEIAVATGYADWTPQAVLERGLDMLAFMERRWSISLGWVDQKRKFLGL